MQTHSPETWQKFLVFLTVFAFIILISLFTFSNSSYAEPINYALSFDGVNDNVKGPLIYDIFGGDGWRSDKTISLWIKPNGPGKPCAEPNPGHCEFIIGVVPRSWGITRGILNEDQIYVWNIDTDDDNINQFIRMNYTPDQWIHITMVHSGGKLRAYKFSVQEDPKIVSSGPSFSVDTEDRKVTYLTIGGFIKENKEQYIFNGTIDEIRIYNYALSPDDILNSLYQELTPPFNSGLKAYYRMSNGTDVNLSDDSGNNQNAVLREGLETAVPPGGPSWIASELFGSGPTPTLPSIYTFTPTPYPQTPAPTPDPNTNNFLFLPMVRK
ncbi:MAG: LamG domain-containing protein [Chloroflexota bacterium]